MILIGRGLDFRRLTEKQFSEKRSIGKGRKKSLDVQLSGCRRTEAVKRKVQRRKVLKITYDFRWS